MSLRSKNPPNVAATSGPGSIAHPLGSGAATSGSSTQVGSSSHTITQHSRQPQRQQQQRYVPYTPRQQRHGAHGQGHPPQQPSSQPTQLPQPIQSAQPLAQPRLSNLKSSAKEIEIETTTVGWAILERLINEASQAVSSPNTSDSNSWGEVWSAITTGKAALLLPYERSSTTSHDQNEKITLEMVKDHVVFVENVFSQRQDRQVITLSGLRGVLHGNTITFRSTLHPTSKLHHALLHPSSRLSAFSHLPPLPQHCHITVPGDPPVPYPSFVISNPPSQHQHQQPTILSIPTFAGIQPKPPLPPRPSPSGRSSVASAHASNTPSVATTLPGLSSSPSRLPNPFASFFGGKPNVALSATSSASNSPSMYTTSLPPENVQDGGGVQPGMGTTMVDVPVWVIDRTIAGSVLGGEINATVYAEIAHALTSKTTTASKSGSDVRSDMIIEEHEGEEEREREEREEKEREEFDIPEWVLERVNEFLIRLGMYPFVHKTLSTKESHENSRGDGGGGDGTGPLNLTRRLDVAIAGRSAVNAGRRRSRERDRHPTEVENEGGEYAVSNAAPGGVEEVAIAVQDFYTRLEREVRLRQEKASQRRRERERREGEGKIEEGEEQKDKQKKEDEEVDRLVKRVIEAVETVLCSLFYDRLFMQPDSDDASHDETLASRVAALNVLDLTLEHLDIDVGEAGEELEWVVRACGETLMQLEACHSPADKASALVGAHKVVVDGLSKLPPIRLIPEEESRANRAKQQAQAQPKQAPKPPFGAELKEMPSRSGGGSPSPVLPEIIESQAAGAEETAKEGPPEGIDAKASKKPPPLPLSPPVSMTSLPPDKLEPDNSTKTTTQVSGDLLLPILIFSVAKTNPSHLVSHLLFTQRFRNPVVASSGSGEEGYCLVNLMAVAKFLENVDLEALGLIKEGDRPLPSAAQLTPIPIVRSLVIATHAGEEGKARIEVGTLQGTLRGRVEQQVDAIAGSANKVLVGVMDTSFGMLKSLLPGQGPVPGAGIPVPAVVVDSSQPQPTPTVSPVPVPATGSAPWSVIKPSFGLLKRESGFSIANFAASLPINRGPKSGEEDGQQMVTVSRPASVRSPSLLERGTGSDDDGVVGEGTGQEEGGEEDGDAAEAHSGEGEEDSPVHQFDDKSVKSIRSFESMMTESGKGKKMPSSKLTDGRQKSTSGQDSPVGGSIGRKSLTDRLAHMSALAGTKGSPNGSRRGSFSPNANALGIPDAPSRSTTSTPQGGPLRVAPPVQRFLECTPDDLRISEVGQLLREYRRLADVIRMAGGFSDEA